MKILSLGVFFFWNINQFSKVSLQSMTQSKKINYIDVIIFKARFPLVDKSRYLTISFG